MIYNEISYKSFKFFLLFFIMISVILFKMGEHSNFHLSSFQIVGAQRDFTVVTKLIRNLRFYIVLGDALSKLETFVWILNHNSFSVGPKSIILDQMTNFNMIFHVVMSVYRLVKI